MNNEIYAILAESAELELATMSKYVGYELTNEDVKEFVKDKAGAATTALKRLYEKIIAMIDEVILKVLNFKDKAELGGLIKAMGKTVYKPNNKMKVNSFKVGSIAPACDSLSSNIVNITNATLGNIDKGIQNGESFTDKDIINRLINNIFVSLKKGNTLNAPTTTQGTYTKASIEPTLNELFVTINKDAVNVSQSEFDAVKTFITSKSTKGVIYLKDSLRRLKIACKKMYTESLRELKNDAKELLKDAEGYKAKDDIREGRREGAKVVKMAFEVVAIFISGMMKVIKEAIKYCKQVRKGMSNTKGEKGDVSLDKVQKNLDDLEKKVDLEESFGYDDIDLAILEAELMF